MMLAAGFRLSHHLRDCDSLSAFGLPSAVSSSAIPLFPLPCPRNALSLPLNFPHRSFLSSTAAAQTPILSDCFSPREDDRDGSSDVLSSVAGGIVALGKFDALHIGHRELAIQASKVGRPFLLSFAGIAEVLGWEPRAPIVAQCDRKRVLSSWLPYCGNSAPSEFQIEFSSVRYLTPREFVEKLSKELGVGGVVAGESYRFGYKAAGDALELVRLCEEYQLEAYIIKSVMDKNQKVVNSGHSKERGQVSSTRVRYALSIGDMKYVSELLGRRHRVVLMVKGVEGVSNSRSRVSAPKSCLLNLAPKEGVYSKCFICTMEDKVIPCGVVIDSTHVHIEINEQNVGTQDYLYVEFDEDEEL